MVAKSSEPKYRAFEIELRKKKKKKIIIIIIINGCNESLILFF